MAYQDKIYNKYLSLGFEVMNTVDYERTSKVYNLNYSDIMPSDLNAEILDIGCGMGHFLYYLKKLGYRNFQGVEVGHEQVEFCRKNITERIELVEDTPAFLDQRKNSFDLIVMNDVLEHFSKEDAFGILIKALASLKAGGRLIIKTPNMANLFAASSLYIDFTHETGFSELSLPQILKAAGFRNVCCRGDRIYISSAVKRAFFYIARKAYLSLLKIVILLDRPGDNYPTIFSKNLIVWADK
jgi:2-polyprenyl-3-methyl-5-hydroxy-6-metoxy-1,4-benzoquinol methylase